MVITFAAGEFVNESFNNNCFLSIVNQIIKEIYGYSGVRKPRVRQKGTAIPVSGNYLDLILDTELEANEPPRKSHAPELWLTRKVTINVVTGIISL